MSRGGGSSWPRRAGANPSGRPDGRLCGSLYGRPYGCPDGRLQWLAVDWECTKRSRFGLATCFFFRYGLSGVSFLLLLGCRKQASSHEKGAVAILRGTYLSFEDFVMSRPELPAATQETSLPELVVTSCLVGRVSLTVWKFPHECDHRCLSLEAGPMSRPELSAATKQYSFRGLP